MKIKCDVVSDKGRRRVNNEDMALACGVTVRDDKELLKATLGEKSRFAAIVADGMGGYGGGEIASEIVAKSFDQFLINMPDGLDHEGVKEAVNKWLAEVQEVILMRQKEPGLDHMGTTLTGLFTYNTETYMVNAGDSRVYRFRDGVLRQLSIDHSERVRLNNPLVPSNLIYNAIGVNEAFIETTIMSAKYPIVSGDKYVICSDGLSDMIEDEQISEILSQGGDAAKLVEAALEAGGKDNCTVILLEVTSEPTPPATENSDISDMSDMSDASDLSEKSGKSEKSDKPDSSDKSDVGLHHGAAAPTPTPAQPAPAPAPAQPAPTPVPTQPSAAHPAPTNTSDSSDKSDVGLHHGAAAHTAAPTPATPKTGFALIKEGLSILWRSGKKRK